MSENVAAVLDAARRLPLNQQHLIAWELLKSRDVVDDSTNAEQAAALEIVEKTRGVIKGLDRETLIRIAEDEEFCGY